MLRFQSLFRRLQTARSTAQIVKAPKPLNSGDLKHVSGGLPASWPSGTRIASVQKSDL